MKTGNGRVAQSFHVTMMDGRQIPDLHATELSKGLSLVSGVDHDLVTHVDEPLPNFLRRCFEAAV